MKDSRRDRDRDRPGQAGPPRVRLRRRGDRALAAYPRPRRGQHRLADRRLPVRAAGPGRADGLGDVAGDRRSRSAGSAGSACSTSRGSGPATTTRTPLLEEVTGLHGEQATARMQEIYTEPIKAELITERLREMREAGRHRGRLAVAAADPGVRQDRGRRGRRHVRHPRHDGQRRARLLAGRAAEPQGVHLRARRAGDRRRLRHPPGRAAPDAHRRGRRTRRLRRRRRAHHPHRPRRRGADGLGGRRRRRRPPRLPRRVRRPLRARHRGRLDRQVRRHRQGDRLRRRRGDGRLAVRPRHRRPGPRLPLGRRGAPPRPAPRRAGASSRPSAPSRRSCSAPPGSPTAP